MEREQLKNLLSQLRDELAKTDELDADLQGLASDIDNQLDRLVEEDHSLAEDIEEQFEEAAVKFEANYPRTGAILRELGDILSKMGI